MADALPLLAVPNVSEGRDGTALDAIGAAFARGSRLLDVHADPDHHRAVFTLAGRPGELAQAVLAGAREAVARIDLSSERGVHPHVGAVDVAPIVYLNEALRGAACAEALVTAELIASELDVPVFLYGVLAGGRTRAELRRGGRDGLAARLAAGELRPDFGPGQLHPSAGAMLVAARPPLVAFNVELAVPADLALARAIAAELRESAAGGLPGLRAIGLELASRAGAPQVSMNVEDPGRLALAAVVEEIGRRAPIACAEIVGLVQAAALEGFPEDVELRGFDPARQIIENALRLVT
jgi:glutamate formiminotransferase/glutamate formiminotransferase/formiminotetrahydrofolate cyclodeaminase